MEKTIQNLEEIRKERLKKGPLSEEERGELRELRKRQYGPHPEASEAAQIKARVQELQFREEHFKGLTPEDHLRGLTPEEEQEYQELLPFTKEATARKAGEWTPEDAKKLQRFYQLAEKRKEK